MEAPVASGGRFRAWMELVRLPNLFTVPGDPLAGYFLAVAVSGQFHPFPKWHNVVAVAAASTFIYVTGLIWNDVAHFSHDMKERPSRPLPSGRISPTAASVAGTATALIGLLCAYLAGPAVVVPAIGLLCLALFYDFFASRFHVAGSLAMGCCRGFSMYMGIVMVHGLRVPMDDLRVLISFVCLIGYIASVTYISRNETSQCVFRIRNWLPALLLSLFLALCVSCHNEANLVFLLPALTATLIAINAAISIHGACQPARISAAVGHLIMVLPLYQFAVVNITERTPSFIGWTFAIALALWGAGTYLGKRFYAS